jgi:protein TonB
MANGIAAVGIAEKLAPRLDPRHINARPELPHTLGSYVMALSLELRILVLPDGSVGDAQIVRSTGQGEIDQIAIETVKASWHYLPASINGKPIEAWTTAMVRFAPI